MTFLLISFVAGVLTVLAPCILPLLPVVVGSAAASSGRATPLVVVGSLAASVVVFTFVLKVSVAFVNVPPDIWTYFSGGILAMFGFVLVFPTLWENLPFMARLSSGSNAIMGTGFQKKSYLGDAMVGIALGPIFSTCSPTYFVILASVLPASFIRGSVYILAYVLGLSAVLFLIALLGQRFADRLGFLSDPRSVFKRAIGVLFIILGIFVMFGLEKKIETAILESGFFDITQVEQRLLQAADTSPAGEGEPYAEITDPSGFVNTGGEPITIGQYVGKKVILIDFMTYSCINCQRTIPYMVAWYDKYKDQGLEIIAIHTPEFAFEKDIDNVRAAVKRLGIEYPVALDNDYATWRAWGNQYWPRKYLIDIHGNVVYDHIGEGAYEETEKKIQELLAQRAQTLGQSGIQESGLAASSVSGVQSQAQSPETYFGSMRNGYLANGTPGASGEQHFALPAAFTPNALYLGGAWHIEPEYAQAGEGARVAYRYYAKNVYMVMEADAEAQVEVRQDGVLVKSITVEASTLYTLVQNDAAGEHVLELVMPAGVRVYTFTFG